VLCLGGFASVCECFGIGSRMGYGEVVYREWNSVMGIVISGSNPFRFGT
jgi:hypothetical protein